MQEHHPADEPLGVRTRHVPIAGPRKPRGAMRDRHYVWKRAQKDLLALGLRRRRVHDLRRTGLSLAQEDGADENMLKRGTHAPPKHVVGLYTTVAWEALCREVAKLKLAPRETLSEDAMPMVAYRRLKSLTPAEVRERLVASGPTGTKPRNNEALGIPRASSGGAGNRTRVRKTFSDWSHARLPE